MSNYPPNYDQSLGSVPNQQLSSSQGINTNEQPMNKKPLGEWVTGEQSANANKDWLGGSKQPVAPLSTLSMLSGESSLLHQQGQGQGQGQQGGGMLNRIMHPQQQQQQQTMGEKSSGAVFHDQRDQFYPPQQQQSEHPYLQPYPQPIQQQQPPQQQQPFQQQQQPYLQQQQQPYQQPIQQQQPQSRGVLSNILHPHHRSSSTSSTGNTTLAPTTDTTTATTPKKGGLLSSLFGHKRQSSASHSRSTSGSSSTATTSAPFVSVPVEAGMGSGVSDIMSNMFGTDVSRGVVHNEGVLGQPPMLSDRSNLVGQQQQQPLMTGPSMGPSSGLATGVGTGLATGVGTGLISHHLSNNNNNSNVPTSPMVGSTQNVLARISGKLSPFHSLSARDASGQLISFSELVGRPVLIVNVALESRLANQFGGLQALYEKYRNQGFEILAFPCDQFGGSAPGTSLELRDLIMRNFGVTFPIMEKVDVDGLGTHPVFRYLKSQKSNILIEAVKWNFEKFLIDGNGNVIERWNSSAGVEAIEPHIARLLL